MSKKSSIISNVTNWKVIMVIQIIASLALIGVVLKLGALPMMYTIIGVVFIILLSIGTFFMMKPSKSKEKGSVRTVIGKIVSILLSLVLLLGTLYVAKGDSTLRSITGADSEVTTFSVIVLKDSKLKSISQLKGKTVEMCKVNDKEEHINKAVDVLKKEVSDLNIKNVDNYLALADDLYSGKVEAIYVNEAFNGIFEEKYPAFTSETRVLYNYDIVEKIENISKKANVTDEVFTIYISGIDTRGKVSTVSRSDVNMLVTVSPKTKQILMTSIPRDYFVTLPNKGKKDKLTHAGLGGVNNSVKAIEGFMGIDINYYARVNFTSLITMVDALGGIVVDSPVAFTSLHGKYNIVKGPNYMDGDKALCFVRERYGLSGGDNDRVKNQQRVLTAMLHKAMSPAIITKYSSVLDAISGSFETNMSSDEISSLIQMQLDDMASWEIVQTQLSGSGKQMTGGAYMPNNKLYYMIPNQDSINKCSNLIKQMNNGEKISITE